MVFSMGGRDISQSIYNLKNVLVSHTGLLGRELEKIVAEKWIDDIKRAVDSENIEHGSTACNWLTVKENDKKAFDVFRKRSADGKYPSVGIALHSFAIGGGEIFPINLANCLWKIGVPVILISCGVQKEDPRIRSLVNPDVPCLSLDSYTQLSQVMNDYNIKVIHSHHAMIDLAAARAIETGRMDAGLVITLHGMYEALDAPRRRMLVKSVFPNTDCFAYIADKNLVPFEEAGIQIDKRFTKIPNGLPSGGGMAVERQKLGIEADDFVLCLVSRAIWEKGWKEAVEAVRLANQWSTVPIHLILVGDGEAYDGLKNIKDSHIHCVGAQNNTRQYLMASDMGFLPSKYAGESFPLSLIDSFMCGKPVLASALGEIPEMVKTESGVAGYIFPLTEKGAVPVRKLAKVIVRIAEDPKRYQRMCIAAQKAAERYDIQKVAEQYIGLYSEAAKQEKAKKRPNVKILISCHKSSVAIRSAVLQPIQVGAVFSEQKYADMLHDDEGDQISYLNKAYCELTAQYWAWKNLKADYYGFFHYRRYLSFSEKSYPEDRYGNVYEPFLLDNQHFTHQIMSRYGWTDQNIQHVMMKYDIVTVKRRVVGAENGIRTKTLKAVQPYTVREQYAAAPYLKEEDLLRTLEIIKERSPEYYQDAMEYLNGRTAYYCNMFVCRADIFHEYCEWLFPILKEFCERTDMSQYTDQELRTPGHIAERLWGVYFTRISKNGRYKVKELQSVVFSHTEPEQKAAARKVLAPMLKLVHRATT